MKRRNKIITYVIGLVSCLFIYFPKWLAVKFDGFTFEQVMFNIMMVTGETNMEAAVTFVKDFLPLFISYTVFMMLLFKAIQAAYTPVLEVAIKNKRFTLKLLSQQVIIFVFAITLVVSTVFMAKRTQLIDFIKRQADRSTVIEEHYVDPNTVELKFPENKRNVIHLVLESMETDFSNITVDGKTVNLIPNLTALSDNYYSVMNKDNGGLLLAPATGWTAASLVAQTSGLPLKVALGNKYGADGTFLPGATTFGDILDAEGYRNVFLLGSDVEFGGRASYYSSHGNYELRDLNYMRNQGKIPEDYKEFWGYEDQKLFEYAQETLLELSAADQPFNLEILTVDSHFMDGYVDESCSLEYDVAYANAIACSDIKIGQFVEWVQDQDFYENTTLVITGDHPTMNGEFMSEFNFDERTIYNVIINPATVPEREDYRLATTMDIFPTMLSAMGVSIPEDYLGLGVDLFSSSPTLSELLGQDYYFTELDKISTFYNEYIIKGHRNE